MKLLLFSLLMISTANANELMDYDVDWNPSREKGFHMLRITIEGCTTQFKIKDEDFYEATANEEALTQALVKAIKRANTGCN